MSHQKLRTEDTVLCEKGSRNKAEKEINALDVEDTNMEVNWKDSQLTWGINGGGNGAVNRKGKRAHDTAGLSLLWEEVEQECGQEVTTFSLKLQQLIQTDGHKNVVCFYSEYRIKTFSMTSRECLSPVSEQEPRTPPW